MPLPGAPRIEHAPLSSNQTLEFTWLSPLNNGGSAITNYRLTLGSGGPTNTYSASVIYAKITGLTNGTLYTATLEASNNSGSTWGPAATFRPFQPQAGGPPSVPTNVAITGTVGNTKASLTWTPSVSGNPNWYALKSYSFTDNYTNTDPTQIRSTADGLTQSSNYLMDIPNVMNAGVPIPYTMAAVNYIGYSDYVSTPTYIQTGGRSYTTQGGFTQITASMSPGIVFGTGAFTIQFSAHNFADGGFFISGGSGNYFYLYFAGNTIYIIGGQSGNQYNFPVRSVNISQYINFHITVCRNDSNQMAIWVNGIGCLQSPKTVAENFSGTNTWFPTAPGGGDRGPIANVRIVVGTALFDVNDPLIQVPVSILPFVPGTQLLLTDLLSGASMLDTSGTQSFTFPTGNAPGWQPYYRLCDPRAISGCIVWLDFGDASTTLTDAGIPCITAGTTSVYTIKDKSGQGNDFITPSGVNPYSIINDQNYAYFQFETQVIYASRISLSYMKSINPAVYPVDMFVVLQTAGAAGGNVFGIASPTVDNYNALAYNSGGVENHSTGGLRTPGTGGSTPNPYAFIIEWSIEDGNYIIRYHSRSQPSVIISQASYNWTMTPDSLFVLGANNLGTSSDPTDYCQGSIGEVIAFNRSISEVERESIGRYLGDKFAIN